MPFLRSLSINTSHSHPFPFNVPAVKHGKNIAIDNRITIFTGDNGTGKSTLLESIAMRMNTPLIGDHIGKRDDFNAARSLQPYLQLEQVRKPLNGFFFRAEDFGDYIYKLKQQKNGNNAFLEDMRGEVADSALDKMAESMHTLLHMMRRDYGENLLALSHGEAYLKIIQTKINDNGIYLLDEPEAALSPLKQLSLISFILEALKSKNSQFIVATHSPIIMGIPGALLYEISEDEIRQTAYEDTEHYRITHSFLSNPAFYLRHL
ncbi:AAA family ATPase [Chitinophaga sp.]|uniref:AAA family ATPase n=1 Tax=Chitinophaga sp. TaxID=1869181 RepID=UPI002F95BB15